MFQCFSLCCQNVKVAIILERFWTHMCGSFDNGLTSGRGQETEDLYILYLSIVVTKLIVFV